MRQLLLSVSIATALGLVASGCQGNQGPAPNPQAQAAPAATAEKIVDEHSFAQPDKVRITDIALDLAVNFDARTLSGSATYALDWTDKAATQLVLDTRDLTIEKAEGLIPRHPNCRCAWLPVVSKPERSESRLRVAA